MHDTNDECNTVYSYCIQIRDLNWSIESLTVIRVFTENNAYMHSESPMEVASSPGHTPWPGYEATMEVAHCDGSK